MTLGVTTPPTPEQAIKKVNALAPRAQSRRRSPYFRVEGGRYLPSAPSSLLGQKRNAMISDVFRRWNGITFKYTVLTCCTAIGWAFVIVYILGPATPQQRKPREYYHKMTSTSTLDSGSRIPEHPPPHVDRVTASEDGSRPSLGRKKTDFLGRGTFPGQFRGWGDTSVDVPVVVNKMDSRPLMPANETLLTVDLVLTILSKDTRVRGLMLGCDVLSSPHHY